MERPSLTLKINDYEIRWTYGLQQDMQRLMPDPAEIANLIMTDPYVRDYLVRRALTPSKKMIEKEEELIAIEDMEIDPDQIIDILDWIAEHLLYFFAKSAGNMSRHVQTLKEVLPALSTSGSEASV